MPPRPLRLCLIDLSAGEDPTSTRAFRRLASSFFAEVATTNPTLPCALLEVSPRDTSDVIPQDCDFYIATGGPGSPRDADGTPWSFDFSRTVDAVMASATRGGPDRQAFFGICYSFELIVQHLRIAQVRLRPGRKFGVTQVRVTPQGQRHPLLASLGEAFFAFEQRSWEVVDLDQRRLQDLGGQLLARETPDEVSPGHALLAFDAAPGIEAVQFHPESDPRVIARWLARSDQSGTLEATYGAAAYRVMVSAAADPEKLGRTYATVLPGWLRRHFNALCQSREYAAVTASS